jgi:uncharacterized protein (DUF2235 family)
LPESQAIDTPHATKIQMDRNEAVQQIEDAEVSPSAKARTGKNIVICLDGTNNQFGAVNTNVVRLVQILDRTPGRQLLYYDPGVGTIAEPGAFGAVRKWISKVAGLAFGAGLDWKVQEAYTYLMDFWQAGDRVFIFGFSRGAYSARVLAGMLYTVGLLPRGGYNLAPYAMRLYREVRKERSKSDAEDWAKLCSEFRWTFARQISDNDQLRGCLGYRVFSWLGLGPSEVPVHRPQPWGADYSACGLGE